MIIDIDILCRAVHKKITNGAFFLDFIYATY